ncbi:MAG: DUF4860 domain-containing protein, partial [Coriobacteriales bacterium]|nr:DUF4860 domain-containing protein [Coriobacteriales bacterium]
MKRRSVDLFVVLALFCVYITSALLLSTIGAGVYKDTAAVMQDNYDLRTGALYVAEKTRQSDVNGAVRIDSYEGNDALVMTEQETGQGYETWIFVSDGVLYEEFIASGADVQLGNGQAIMPMQSMDLSLNNELLSIDFVTVNDDASAEPSS